MAAGVQIEGDIPSPEPEARLAIKAWNLLCNGMGGIDWAGLPYVCELLGVDDVAQLLERFLVIKIHRPGDDDKED